MLIGKFIGKMNADDTHSNEYGKDGVIKPQSFEERKAVDTSRQVVGAFRHSMIGRQYAPRMASYRDKKRQDEQKAARGEAHIPSRQEQNASGGATGTISAKTKAPSDMPRSFSDPPSRGYNPYA